MPKAAESAVGFEDVVAAWSRGDPHATRELCGRLLARRPRHVETLSLLGASSLMLGEAQSAEACFRKALVNQPGHVPSNYMLANMLRESGDLRAARLHYQRALDGQPALVEAWINLGICLGDLGKLDEAIDCYAKALALRPGEPLALYNLGNTHQQETRFAEAVDCYRQALIASPRDARLHFNLGNALLSAGQPEQAIESFGAVLKLDAQHAGALTNRGVALRRAGRLLDAIDCLEQAVALNPQNAAALLTLGNTLAEGGRPDLAVPMLDRVVALEPRNADALYTLGTLLLELKQIEAANACFAQSRSLQPGKAKSIAGALAAEMMLWDDGAIETTSRELLEILQNDPQPVPVGTILQISDDPQLVRSCAERLSASLLSDACAAGVPEWDHGPRVAGGNDQGRIKVAYLSPDFGDHPVGLSIVELLEKHGPRIDLLAISLQRRPPSPVTSRIATACPEFIDASTMSNGDLARVIANRGVDIAVDLAGHTYGNRAQVLAMRPAPVQAGYLGFAHTMGAAWMDYLIVDKFVAPPGSDGAFSEALFRLPHSFFPTDGRVAMDGLNCARLAEGLPERGFVFCCFNSAERISVDLMDAWLRILGRVGDSVLWLRLSNELAMARMRARAARAGVDPQRLVFARHAALREEHLARHRLADLYLDTFPYNSHSTSRDALFVGLPVLTRSGRSFASRVAGSLLTVLELPELIVENLADYERRAIALASDTAQLAGIRYRVNHAPQRARLFDSAGLALAMEYGFALMHQRRLQGELARSFDYAS